MKQKYTRHKLLFIELLPLLLFFALNQFLCLLL